MKMAVLFGVSKYCLKSPVGEEFAGIKLGATTSILAKII